MNCSFALLKEDQDKKYLLATSQTKTRNNLVDIAADLLNGFLKLNKVAYKDIEKIYLNIGPGSFTGEKAGLNIAKTIWSLNETIDIYTANTIEILTEMNGVGILDAKGQKSYVGVYENFNCLEPVKLVDNAEVESIITQYPHLPTKDYEGVDERAYFHGLLAILDSFTLEKNPKHLEPLYIKEPL